jgi:hypothetical protein
VSYSVYCWADFGENNTGLTIHGKLLDMSGGLVGSAVTSGIVESSEVDGAYSYTLSAPDGHAGAFIMYDSANTKTRRTVVIAPRETENSDVKTSTRGTSTLTTGDIDSRLAAYDAPTKAELDTAQTSITDAIDDLPDTASIVASIKATAIMTGVSLEDVLRNLWSATVGDSDGDDADDPASVTYKDATGAVDVTHALTDTTRRVTTA